MLPVFLIAQSNGKSYSNQNKNTYELSIGSGFGSYLMPNLKDLQNTIIRNSEIPLLKTTSFPSYFNYSLKFGYKKDNGYEGFTGGFMSTGARSSLSDYSGYYVTDINCVAIHFGYYFRKVFANYQLLNRPVEMGYMYNISSIYSFVTLTDNLQLYGYGDVTNENYTFNSIGIYTEPMLYADYMFTKYIGLELCAGAGLSISSPLYYESIKNDVVIYDKNRFANWSGYRLSIGLISRF